MEQKYEWRPTGTVWRLQEACPCKQKFCIVITTIVINIFSNRILNYRFSSFEFDKFRAHKVNSSLWNVLKNRSFNFLIVVKLFCPPSKWVIVLLNMHR